MDPKIVVITGASSGIGASCAKSFLEEGHVVVGVARTIGHIEAFAPFENNWRPLQADLSQENSVLKLIQAILNSVNRVDFLIHNAGVGRQSPLPQLKLSQWQETMMVNVTAPFMITQGLLPLLQKSAFPCIIHVSSIAGKTRSLSLGADYSSSKAALLGLNRHLAAELGPLGIRVNAVCPSQTQTPMLDGALSEGQKIELAAKIPLRRLATIDEQVDVIRYLCSPQSAYIHGAAIDVNGGQL